MTETAPLFNENEELFDEFFDEHPKSDANFDWSGVSTRNLCLRSS